VHALASRLLNPPPSQHLTSSSTRPSRATQRTISTPHLPASFSHLVAADAAESKWLMLPEANARRPFYFTPFIVCIRSVKWR